MNLDFPAAYLISWFSRILVVVQDQVDPELRVVGRRFRNRFFFLSRQCDRSDIGLSLLFFLEPLPPIRTSFAVAFIRHDSLSRRVFPSCGEVWEQV